MAADETTMSSLNAFEAPPRSSRVPTRQLPRTLLVPGAAASPVAPVLASAAPSLTRAASVPTIVPKVQEVARLAPSIPAPATVRPSSPRTGMMAIVAAAPTPTPVATKRKKKKSGRLAGKVLAVLLLMALAAGGAFVYQRVRPSGPPHPKAWDAQVLPLVRFVEQARGLAFEHPVFVDLLTDREYGRKVAEADGRGAASASATAAADHRDLANAFGLATAYDAAAAEHVLSGDSSLGTYSTRSDRILIRGTELTAGVRVTLIHELTHALQAQHFDLQLGGATDLATRSVAEADASRIAAAYLTSLTPDEQTAVSATNSLGAAEAEALAAVPWPMVELRFLPYRLGPGLVNAAAAAGGNASVDELFRHLPNDALLIGPWRRPITTDIAAPSVRAPKGSTLVQAPTTLSVMQALVMLDAWLPWRVARDAVDHWVAGSYVAYRTEADATLCIDVAATFDATPTAFSDAVASWAAVEGSTATPVDEGRTVRFTACDRGPAAANPPVPVLSPSTELSTEIADMAALIGGDPAAITAELCVERTLIDNPLAAPLLALPALAADQQAAVDLSRVAARQTCGL